MKVFLTTLAVFISLVVSAQSDLLLTSGKVKKVYVYSIDYFHVRYAKKTKPDLNLKLVGSQTKQLEQDFLKELYKINAKYSKNLENYKSKGKTEKEIEDFSFDQKIKQAREEEKLQKKKDLAIAKLSYEGLRKKRKELVFSVTTEGVEQVIYSPDTLGFLDSSKVEVEYNVGEMRRYIKGEQDGRKTKSPWATVWGTGIGAIGGIGGAFWGPVIPATYVVLVAVKKKNKNLEKQVPKPELLDDEAYMDGFNKTAKRHKVANAMYGGIAGLAVGIGTYLYLFRFK